jgi:hypothetical protein
MNACYSSSTFLTKESVAQVLTNSVSCAELCYVHKEQGLATAPVTDSKHTWSALDLLACFGTLLNISPI